jgi:micrococcal nuclease
VKKFLSLILFLFLLPSYSFAKSFGDFEGAVYVRNSDGDTIIFDLPGPHPLRISIRVNGIDTPEINGKCEKEKYDAQQAQQMVADILMDAEQITLKNIVEGKYFELAADVYVDGDNLAGLLIVAGMAVIYDGERKAKNWCEGGE